VITKSYLPMSELSGDDPYKLASGLIVPRPIGWIGTVSAANIPNLAPYSFFNCVSGHPPTFVFSPGVSSRKDTLNNVREVGEFTINIVSEETVEAMNASAASVAEDVDEFALAGLTPVPSRLIGPPMVGECKANIECVVKQIMPVGDAELGNALVIGEAVAFHVANDVLDGTRIDQRALKAVGRHVGGGYSRTTEMFEIQRPT